MKAVLLAAGLGQRLKPITDSVSKSMINIAGKPFLEYIINDITNFGFNEICLVIGHRGNQIKEYFGSGNRLNAEIQYVIQKEYKGTADATNCARSFVGKDKFLLYLSDTIIPNGLGKYVEDMLKEDSEIDILSADIPINEISNAGNIETSNGYVTKIREKSISSTSSLAWAGIALFKNDFIFKIIEDLPLSFRGEYEITEAMNLALNHNIMIRNHICDKYIDSGTSGGLIEAMKFILTHKHLPCNHDFVKSNRTVIEPIHIGKNCVVGNNTKIGPFVSIGDNVIIGDNTNISNAIILENTIIDKNQNINRAIINKHSIVSSN